MSVAFRRESDEEHLEPKFEIPIPTGPNLVTARGLSLIRAKVVELETAVADAGAAEGADAIKRDLRYWLTRQATAELAPVPDGQSVEIGCTVRFLQDGRARTVTIVGDDEARPADGILSFSAPLSRAMMHAEVGDLVDFGGRSEVIEILAIETTA